MNVKDLLNQLLQSGQDLAKRGQELAEKGLGIPESGPDRDKAISNLGKGAAAGGVLALLLGTSLGRRVAGPLLKVGGLAAIGMLGYTAYKNWSPDGSTSETGTPIGELTGDAQSKRAKLLLRAMIAAANADSHIDDKERASIQSEFQKLNLTAAESDFVQAEINRPASLAELAKDADSIAAASEVYITSLLIIDAQDPTERNYLDRLALELSLPRDLVNKLETQSNN